MLGSGIARLENLVSEEIRTHPTQFWLRYSVWTFSALSRERSSRLFLKMVNILGFADHLVMNACK